MITLGNTSDKNRPKISEIRDRKKIIINYFNKFINDVRNYWWIKRIIIIRTRLTLEQKYRIKYL